MSVASDNNLSCLLEGTSESSRSQNAVWYMDRLVTMMGIVKSEKVDRIKWVGWIMNS